MTDGHLRVGLVGAGVIGRLAHLPVLARRPDIRIAGVVTAEAADTDEAVRRWPVERGYASAESMIAEAALDALLVLTPKSLHVEPVLAGLEAGLSVFCEKPLATSLADAATLVDAADDSAGTLMVGLNRRFAPVYRAAKSVFAERPPRFAVGQKHRVGTEYRATLENGLHMLDLLRWFCGEAVDVQAHSWAPDPYQEEGAAALIRFDSGSTAVFAAARSAGEWDERLDLYGDATTVRVAAPDRVEIARNGISTVTESRITANGWADITETAGFALCLEHFLDCVRTGAAPLTDGREAYRSQSLAHAVLDAAGLPVEDAASDDPERSAA